MIEVHLLDINGVEPPGPKSEPDEVGPYALGQLIFSNVDREIYNAIHQEFGTRATLVLHPLNDLLLSDQTIDELIEHFQRIKQAELPQLPDLLGFGVTNRYAYMAFEPIQGILLSKQIESNVDANDAAGWMLSTAIAVQVAIDAQACFSEIQSFDILINHLNQPKLLSYGLADQLNHIRTGSVEILSQTHEPAILRSLGLLLFSMLTNENEVEEIKNHLKHGHQPIPLAKVDPSLSPDLDAIYQCCVSVNPKTSYASLEDLIVDLERFVSGKRVNATKLSKTRKWGRS